MNTTSLLLNNLLFLSNAVLHLINMFFIVLDYFPLWNVHIAVYSASQIWRIDVRKCRGLWEWTQSPEHRLYTMEMPPGLPLIFQMLFQWSDSSEGYMAYMSNMCQCLLHLREQQVVQEETLRATKLRPASFLKHTFPSSLVGRQTRKVKLFPSY